MSALRVRTKDGGVRLADPYTLEDYRPHLSTFLTVSTVEVRKATPEELGRPGGPHQARTNIKLETRRRPKGVYLAHLSDTDVLEAVASAPTIDGAAALLRTSQASLSRRLTQIRAGIVHEVGE